MLVKNIKTFIIILLKSYFTNKHYFCTNSYMEINKNQIVLTRLSSKRDLQRLTNELK